MEEQKTKTIFITLFQGVEAKNILRTQILSTLLSDERVQLVLFVKSTARVEYYRREFKSDRIVYEVVEMKRPKGVDAWFAKLKYMLLRTETTDLQREMRREAKGGELQYMLEKFLNVILARPFIRRIVRILDFYFVRNTTYTSYFDKYNPSLVFMAHLFDEQEVHLLREAKKRAVRTVSLINSWDKVTARCILRLLPDRFITYNEIVKEELMQYDEVLAEDIFVAGIAQYDMYFTEPAVSRSVFFNRLDIAPEKKLILYGSMGKTFSSSDWDMIDLLYRLRDAGAFGAGIEILVRFQPNDFIERRDIERRPYLHYDYPGTRFGTERGIDWDMSATELSHLRDTLTHMSLLVCYASSLSIDAAIFDKPIININFEVVKSITIQLSPTQYYRTTHYKKALGSGSIILVESEHELISAVREYLADPARNREERRRLVAAQCVFRDGLSGKRIGNFLLECF